MLADAIRRAVQTLDTTPADQGTVELALLYAAEIDEDGDLHKIGPLLLAALETLLMTPRARAAVMKGGTRDSGTQSPLDELRQRRAGRQHHATPVDTATTGVDA